MAISLEGKIGIGLTLAFAAGATALVLWPEVHTIAWIVFVASLVGLWLLGIYHYVDTRMPERKPKAKIQATPPPDPLREREIAAQEALAEQLHLQRQEREGAERRERMRRLLRGEEP